MEKGHLQSVQNPRMDLRIGLQGFIRVVMYRKDWNYILFRPVNGLSLPQRARCRIPYRHLILKYGRNGFQTKVM